MQLATLNQLSSLLYNWDSDLGREKDSAVLAVINVEVLRLAAKRDLCVVHFIAITAKVQHSGLKFHFFFYVGKRISK